MDYVKVKFGRRKFWFLPDGSGSLNGAIVPLHHVDRQGHVTMTALMEDSFAHSYGGLVKRYGTVIGKLDLDGQRIQKVEE